MRVALVTHNVRQGDGQGRVCLELVRHLAAAGHEIDLYANRVEEPILRLPGVTWRRVAIWLPTPNLIKCLEFLLRATVMLQARHYDVIHLHGAVALVRHQVNTAHFVHGAWLAGGFPEVAGWRGVYHRLYRHVNTGLERLVFGRASRVVAVSPKVADEIHRFLPVAAEAVRCINNGCDTPAPALGAAEREQVRQELWPGLAPHELLVGFAGDIRTARKGIDTVIRAMARLRGAPVRLVVAGATAESPYPAMVAQLGLGEQVRFLGYRRDLSRLFGGLDCLAFPTRYETFGLVVTEAAAAGCPLLISGPAYCGAAGLFPDGQAALWLADPADDADLARKLEYLRTEPGLRRSLGTAAVRAAAAWSWEQMGRAYAELYRSAGGEEGM